MSKEQIEEMAKAMCGNGMPNGNCAIDDEPCYLECVYGCCAEKLYANGYRKQKEGEWIGTWDYECSVCHEYNDLKTKHCPSCGAKMKGGAE